MAQEAQLNALVDFCGWHPVPWQVLVGLLRLDRSSLVGSQAEHFSILMEDADRDWDDDSDLWEHQGRPLTVLDARRALRDAPGDMPVAIELYTGSGREMLSPVEFGYSGRGVQPSSLVLTVTRLKG